MAYQTKVTVDILSDLPIEGSPSLSSIAYEVMYGSWSGHVEWDESVELSREQLEEACGEHGTDVTFFTEWEDEIKEE